MRSFYHKTHKTTCPKTLDNITVVLYYPPIDPSNKETTVITILLYLALILMLYDLITTHNARNN